MHATRSLPYVLVLAACGASPSPAPSTPGPGAPPPLLTAARTPPDAAAAPGDAATPVARPSGPLSYRIKVTETPWSDRQTAMRRNEARMVDKAGMLEEFAAYFAMVDQFYATRTREQAEYLRVARDRASPARLSPYPSSVASLARGFLDVGSRQRICARPPDEMWHCDPFITPASTTAVAPYAITEEAPGVMRLAIGDLSNGDAPAWSRFDADLAPLANAKAIVLDLREATGGDPRPLLPWLARVTGRHPLRALRAINRPATADPYVAAYAARFATDHRDRAVWAPLVGTMPAPTTRPTRARIAVVISPRCGAACELAARVLETYAGAIVLGNPAHYMSRLHRDEPALLVLPRSAVEIYFYATEYLLSRDIEARTGTTGEWNAFAGEGFDGDLVAAAVRELTEPRLAKRCTAYPAYTTRAAMPQAAAAKLHGDAWSLRPRGCSEGVEVTLHSDMPQSSLRRFAATCSRPPDVTHYVNDVFSIGDASYAVLTQLAQSDLVKAIYIRCSHRPTIR